MPRQAVRPHVSPGYLPEIRTIGSDRPWAWLRQGWSDLRKHPAVSISYGLLIAAVYAAIVLFALTTGNYHVGVQLTAGFILVAPVLALGFYGISQRSERGDSVRFRDIWRAWRCNPNGVLGIGVIMVLLFLTWFMVSMQTTAFLAESKEELVLFLGGAESWEGFTRVVVTQLSVTTLLAYFLVGLVAVLVAFAFTAVSIPLLMDRPHTDAITALVASWKAVTANWRPMALWAVLIALITGAGLALFYIGLAVTMPLLGFATWHAYRDLLGSWREVELPEVEYY